MTDEIYADINNALPPHTRLSSNLTINEGPIPITAMVNGKKMKVGEGTLDPETGMFEGAFDSDNAAADIIRERFNASNSVASTSFSVKQVKRLSVEEVHLSIQKVITKADLLSVSLVAEEPNPDYGVYPVEHPPYGVSNKYIDRSLMEEIKEKEGPTPKFHDHD